MASIFTISFIVRLAGLYLIYQTSSPALVLDVSCGTAVSLEISSTLVGQMNQTEICHTINYYHNVICLYGLYRALHSDM